MNDEFSDLLLEAVNDKQQVRESEMRWRKNGCDRILNVRASFMEDEDCRMGLCLMLSKKA